MTKTKDISETITLEEVRRIIRTGEAFSCSAVKLSEQRKKGGEITRLLTAKLLTEELYLKFIAGRPMTPCEKEKSGLTDYDPSVSPDNPKWIYGIRHILTGPNFSEIRTIRPLLITVFNHKKVIA